MSGPTIDRAFLERLDAALAHITGLGRVNAADATDLIGVVRTHFRAACLEVGFSPAVTTDEMLDRVAEGVVRCDSSSHEWVNRYLLISRLVTDLTTSSELHHEKPFDWSQLGQRSRKGRPLPPTPTAFAAIARSKPSEGDLARPAVLNLPRYPSSLSSASHSPPPAPPPLPPPPPLPKPALPPANHQPEADSSKWLTAGAITISVVLFLTFLIAWISTLDTDRSDRQNITPAPTAHRSDGRAFVERNRPLISRVAAHTGSAVTGNLTRAMAAHGFMHAGITDADWYQYPTQRMLECYYSAAEAHTDGSGGRALALLSRDLGARDIEYRVRLLNEFATRELTSSPPVRFDPPPAAPARQPRRGVTSNSIPPVRFDPPPSAPFDNYVPPQHSKSVRLIATILDASSGTGIQEDTFRATGYDHPGIPQAIWSEFSAVQKVACMYLSAEVHAAGTGERALALLSRALAQRYESVANNPAIEALLVDHTVFDRPLGFASLHPSDVAKTPPLPEWYREVAVALAEYAEGGVFGLRGILMDVCGLSKSGAFEVLRSSETPGHALERGLMAMMSDDARQTALETLSKSLASTYESARMDPVISKFLAEQQAVKQTQHWQSNPNSWDSVRRPMNTPPPPRARGR